MPVPARYWGAGAAWAAGRAGGPGDPGSAADLRHALGEFFNVFMLKCAFLFIGTHAIYFAGIL